jgi:hypothetical protein
MSICSQNIIAFQPGFSKKSRLFFLFFFLKIGLFAQGQFPLKFDSQDYDFGPIGELSGKVYHHFSFENTSTDTLWILDVKADCHCTVGDFPQKAIAPKEIGSIKVSYDPKNRPWEFETGVNVRVKNKTGTQRLTLKGKTQAAAELGRFAPAEYIQRFLYNEKSILSEDPEFKVFVKKMVPLLEKHKDIKIQIESSASKVPTKSFASNEELTRSRAREARDKVLEILNSFGADLDKVIFLDDQTLVQGPEYTSDFKKQLSKYQPFQYVKIKVF